MSIFSRLFSRGPSAPHWARFFTRDQYANFQEHIERELRSRGLQYKVSDGVVHLEGLSEEPQQMGLQNVAQLCNQTEAENWPGLIQTHFENLFAAREQRQKLQEQKTDFAAIKHLLKVRIFPEEMPEKVRENSVSYLLAPGILAMLSYDMPTSIETVAREDAAKWEMSDEALLELGLENVIAQDQVKLETIDVPDGPRLYAVVGESFFTATHALQLERHIAGSAEHGALVALPHRHAVLFHPIHNKNAIPAVQAMLVMAHGMHADGPGSISPSLYWWRDGKLTLLPSHIEKKKLVFEPPDDFARVIAEVCE
jgi:hypothetical protein